MMQVPLPSEATVCTTLHWTDTSHDRVAPRIGNILICVLTALTLRICDVSSVKRSDLGTGT
jgi:hypothetical protein